MYKITFNLKAPVSFIQRPVFDSILAYCYMKEKYGMVEQKTNIENVEDFSSLPIIKHPEGYFMSSWMLFDETKAIEFTSTWKKRWDNKHDHLADFGKRAKKVRINAGEFKSYDMPIVLQNINEVWFFFESDDITQVETLIKKHLWGLSKKTSQGYGEIGSFEINEINYNPFVEKVIRPIPAKPEDVKKNLSVRMMGYRPPYWLPENQTFCIDE